MRGRVCPKPCPHRAPTVPPTTPLKLHQVCLTLYALDTFPSRRKVSLDRETVSLDLEKVSLDRGKVCLNREKSPPFRDSRAAF